MFACMPAEMELLRGVLGVIAPTARATFGQPGRPINQMAVTFGATNVTTTTIIAAGIILVKRRMSDGETPEYCPFPDGRGVSTR